MRKLVPAGVLIAIAGALALFACVESKDTTTVNPNGSAKITIDAFLSATADIDALGGLIEPQVAPKITPEDKAKKQVNDYLAKAQGVDAWRDIMIEVAKDGRTHVKATAFVPDVSKFRLDMVPFVAWSTDGKGNGQLKMVDEAPASRPAPPKLTEEEIAKRIPLERQKYQTNKPIMQLTLGGLKIDATYDLPGTVGQADIFTKTGPSQVKLFIEGNKFLEAADKLMKDDAKVAAMIRKGRTLQDDTDFAFEAVFGKKGPALVKVTGATKALFNYDAEMSAAKSAQAEMLKKLGIDLKPPSMLPPDFFPPN